MESEWISVESAMEILGIGRMPANRLAQAGAVTARKAEKPHANGHYSWEFDRASCEERAARMKQQPEDPGEWIPIATAMKLLGMSRHGIKRRAKMGHLETRHFGPAEKPALFVRRSQVEAQMADKPRYQRQTEWAPLDAEKEFVIWFAGFFDGEGCIGIRKYEKVSGPVWALEMSVPNSGVEAILAIEEKIGGKSYFRKRQKPTYRDQRIWQSGGDEALVILEALRPYLLVKHQQADLAIEFQQRVRSRRFGRWDRIPEEEEVWRDAQMRAISRLNRPNAGN